LFYQDEVSLLDFGCCGFGFYLWDIAVSFSYVAKKYRNDLLEAYNTIFPLPDSYEKLLEGFYAGMFIEAFNFYIGAPDADEWIINKINELATNEFIKYTNDERFLLV